MQKYCCVVEPVTSQDVFLAHVLLYNPSTDNAAFSSIEYKHIPDGSLGAIAIISSSLTNHGPPRILPLRLGENSDFIRLEMTLHACSLL